MRKGEIRDCHMDSLLTKRHIKALEVINQAATTSGVNGNTTLRVGFSVGSPTYTQVTATRHAGIQFNNTTTTIDYLWRVPSEVDKNWPIYFRHHWTASGSGATPTVSWTQYVATLSSASSLASSPTAVLNTVVPPSTNSSANSFSYNLTGRGMIAPLATGLAAYQVMDDNVEMLHITIQPTSVNYSMIVNTTWWMGMDIEFTPRRTFGSGSQREGRKTETNLGFQEVGTANDYGN